MIKLSAELRTLAFDETNNAKDIMEKASQKIFALTNNSESSKIWTMPQVVNETVTLIEQRFQNNSQLTGIPSGISKLDSMTSGFQKSELIIIGARPSIGKTAFALNIARNVAVDQKKTVCFFSLEMSRDQLAQRMLSNEASIESEKLRTGDLTTDEWTRLAQAGTNLASSQIYFDETPGITVPEMKAKLRRMKKVDLVVIDYLGLMKSAKATENRVQEVSDITRNLKAMAKELGVPVIACAQLSRGTEVKGKSHKPALSDLRESGSIEQDADIVMFIYRDEYYNPDTEEPGITEIIIGKHRAGPTGTVKLKWMGDIQKFGNLEARSQ